jgi:hypothetical protein
MISLINFGDSPFRALFYLVIGILIAVIVMNIFSFITTFLIDQKTKKVYRSNEKN